MISEIKYKVSSFFSLFQERPVYTVVFATGMSALLVGISLYLFVFAGRSLLPAPLAGDAPATPHMTSVPVQVVSLGQPAAQPPVSPPQEETVFAQLFTQSFDAAATSEGVPAAATSEGAPAAATSEGAPAAATSEGATAVASSEGAPAAATSEGATAVASAINIPDDEKSSNEHDEVKYAVVSKTESQSSKATHRSKKHSQNKKRES